MPRHVSSHLMTIWGLLARSLSWRTGVFAISLSPRAIEDPPKNILIGPQTEQDIAVSAFDHLANDALFMTWDHTQNEANEGKYIT